MGDLMARLTRGRWTLIVTCVIILACLTATVDSQLMLESIDMDGMESVSISEFSISQSQFIAKIPCVFRGGVMFHGNFWKISDCEECDCRNGTIRCDILTCQKPECADPVSISGECCELCPYKLKLKEVFSSFPSGRTVVEGRTNKFEFRLSIKIRVSQTSRQIRGENMWRVDAWVSRSEDGSGPQFSYRENILNNFQRAKEFSQWEYVHDQYWTFNRVKYNFDATEGTCKDFRYFCIKFNVTDEPKPMFDLPLTFSVVKGEKERQTVCTRLGACKGVFADTFDWELEGEDPIPGQDTPVTIGIDVTFKRHIRNLEGDGLWRVALFGSSNPGGDGPRFGEVSQILDADESSEDIREGTSLYVDSIETNFELGTVGCVEDVEYICMEFLKGDAPNPDFTLNTAEARGNATRDSLITCKPQECQSRVVFTKLQATLLSPDVMVEDTNDTDTKVKLKATSNKQLTTTVAGEKLWQVVTFFSKNEVGGGTRTNEQPQILSRTQEDQTLPKGKNLVFRKMDFQVDLDGIICEEVPFMCFELKKNTESSIDFTFETHPLQDSFVDCISMEDVCKG